MTNPSDEAPSSRRERGFAIEAFSVLGDHEGSGWWDYDQLSAKWTAICRELIDHLGPVFDHRWSRELGHIRTRLTSIPGAGIITLFVNDQVASTILVMSGDDPRAESEVAQMFVDSLRSSIPKAILVHGQDFIAVLSLGTRPVIAVVPIPDPQRSESDEDIVRELGLHLAAAVFQFWTDEAEDRSVH